MQLLARKFLVDFYTFEGFGKLGLGEVVLFLDNSSNTKRMVLGFIVEVPKITDSFLISCSGFASSTCSTGCC